MDERNVVTVFLRNGGDLLLLRRSEEVGSYPDRWGAVAGHVEGDPDAAALDEIEEETGIAASAVTLRRRGEPFEVVDRELGIGWTIYPYLFDTETRAVEPNWETAAAEWVQATAILDRETVPALWNSYDLVRPTVETVVDDRTHGSAYISIRALEVLRDEAAVSKAAGETWAEIADVATRLRSARSEMAAVRNRVDEVMYRSLEDRTPAAVHDLARDAIGTAVTADEEAARRAGERIESRTVFTLSRSGTVLRAVRAGDPKAVRVSVSEPGSEGVGVAEEIAADGVDVVLTTDANVPAAVEQSEVVLVGADTVLRDGTVINKVGTTAAMLAARYHDVEAYVVCAAAKVTGSEAAPPSVEGPEPLYDGDENLTVANPIFEGTPGELVDGIITERGTLDREDVEAVAERYAEFATWLDHRQDDRKDQHL